jgi:hypothetical protein
LTSLSFPLADNVVSKCDTPIGKEVAVTVIRGGKEEMTTVKLGQRLVLSGTALDAYRQKLGGMLQELAIKICLITASGRV